MKYVQLASFRADFKRLTPRERALFIEAVRKINDAFARRGNRPLPHWPAALRIKPVEGALGIWELTWSFAGPDGRATFEIIDLEGEPGIRWRRIGGHEVFRGP
ncbi:MAG: hypothetical protein HY675_20905 [Chloroflexi bacterium]|nr:hypothetical protein [Chloroflexota bacterium]